jgi:Tfp pilus assembly protein PilF
MVQNRTPLQAGVGAQQRQSNDKPVQIFVASCLFTAGLALSADFSRRLFGGSADTGSILGTTLQAFLAVMAGGTFTAAGREFARKLFKSVRLRTPSPEYVALWASSFFFVCILAIWQLAPNSLSTAYNWRGLRLESQSLSEAAEAYQHAVSLWPKNADAHYNLGRVYEKSLKSNEAVGEYQQAASINPKYVLAFSNTGRLLILDGKLTEALRMLDAGVAGSSGDPYEDVPLFKNRGWANLELGFLKDAESDLKHSLELKRTAAAECLLAKTYMRAKDEANAKRMWELFRTDLVVQRSDPSMPKVEPDCIRLAEQTP